MRVVEFCNELKHIERRRLFILRELISIIKENMYLKLYLVFFSLINFVYVFFEVLKSMYTEKNSLGTTIEKYQFEYLSNISNIVSFLEILIISMFLICFIITFTKKNKVSINNLILINFGFLIGLFFINYIISFVFSTPSGNVNQQLIIPFSLTVLIIIYLVTTTLYKKVIRI